MSIYNSVKMTGYIQTDKDKSPIASREVMYNGKTFTSIRFILAVPRDYKNQEGKREYDRIGVTATGPTADFIKSYFSPSDVIVIEGSIRTGSMESNGRKQYFTEVRADKAGFPLGRVTQPQKPKEPSYQQQGNRIDVTGDNFGDYAEVPEENLPF